MNLFEMVLAFNKRYTLKEIDDKLSGFHTYLFKNIGKINNNKSYSSKEIFDLYVKFIDETKGKK